MKPNIITTSRTITVFITVLILNYSSYGQDAWLPQGYGLLPMQHGIMGLDAVDDQVCWAVSGDYGDFGSGSIGFSHQPVIFRTMDGGENWESWVLDELVGRMIYHLLAVSPTEVYLSYITNTNSDGVLFTTNGGTTWSQWTGGQMASGAGFTLVRFTEDEWFSYNGGDFASMSADGGAMWTPSPIMIMPANEFTIFANGNNWADITGDRLMLPTSRGRIRISEDRGQSWTISPTPFNPTRAITSMSFHDPMNGMAASAWSNSIAALPSKVIVTSDAGMNWEMRDGPSRPMSFVKAVPGVPGAYIGGALMVDALPGSYMTLDNGQTWTVLDSLYYVNCLDMTSSSSGWIGWGQATTSDDQPAFFKWNAGPVGMAEHRSAGPFNMYPNPTTDRTVTLLAGDIKGHLEVELLDATGKVLDRQKLYGDRLFQLQLADHAPGIYTVRMIGVEEHRQARLVLQ